MSHRLPPGMVGTLGSYHFLLGGGVCLWGGRIFLGPAIIKGLGQVELFILEVVFTISGMDGSWGGWSPGKCIPLPGRHRKTPTLTGTEFTKPYPYWQRFGPESIPLLAQIHKKDTLCGTTIAEKWSFCTVVG